MDWWDWDLAIEQEALFTGKTQAELVGWMGKSKGKIYKALTITKALNQAARALVDENLEKTLKNDDSSRVTKNKGFLITEENLLALAGLDDPELVLPALQMVFDDYLTTDQAQKLVEHLQSGQTAETFNPHKLTPKTPKAKPAEVPAHTPTPHADSHQTPTHTHTASPAASSANGHDKEPLAQPNHAPLADSSSESAEYNRGPQQIASAKGHAAQVPTPAEPMDNWFWKMMVGIKFFNQLRSKVKKGEPLTGWEKCFVWGHAALKGLGEFLKFLKELFKPLAKTIGHAAKKALGDTLSGLLVLLFRIALICLLVWAVIKVIDYGFVYPWHWVESKVHSIFHHTDATPQPTPVSTPQPSVSAVLPKVEAVVAHLTPKKKIEKTTPTITYQPAVSFAPPASPAQTLYDPKILESEIQSLPQNCIVKDYPMTPDESMPGDLAVSRMQDMTDPDKYTMLIGGGKQKILSVNATTTNFIINYKSADALGGFLDGSGQLNFFWEDVKYIHTNEIDIETKTPSVIYQCSLIVSGSKNPLTIQCAGAEDLEHLVSTMQYFIRSSRLGRDTALAGMPYLTQGLRLNNDCVVEKLWANSPADHAALQLGDHLWSVGKEARDQQEKKDLEAGLSTYANGNNNGPSFADSHSESAPSNTGSQPVASTQMQPNLAPRLVGSAQVPITVFAASDSDWNKALIAKNSGMTFTFRPRLRKISLQL
jgi:hypothetical protein